MRKAVVIVALAIAAYNLGGHMRAQQIRANIDTFSAWSKANEELSGRPHAGAYYYGHQFRTDADGRVQMKYADGWHYFAEE
jgi:hypothetical protein